MRTSQLLAARPDFTIRTVTCREHRSGWSPEEPADDHLIVMVRTGSFQIRNRGGTARADALTGYWQIPGRQQQFAHPDRGGDVCTSVTLSPALWEEATGGRPRPEAPALHVDGRTALQHQLLLRAAHHGADPDFDTAERLIRMLTTCLGATASTSRQPRSTAASRSVIDDARQAIMGDHPAARGLIPLARHLGTSPSHLSRCFHRDVGVTVTRYRNRVRISRALSLLEEGDLDMAALAVELGFTDQSHLIRAARTETGCTPGAIRRLLG